MAKGYREPWTFNKSSKSTEESNVWHIHDAGAKIEFIANTWADEGGENARRIAACVNACSGLDTEFLEVVGMDFFKNIIESNAKK